MPINNYSIGRSHIAGLFILRVCLGIFLVISGIEKFININGYISQLSGTNMSTIAKFYVAIPMPYIQNLTESLFYIMIFTQILIGLCIVIGLFTRFFGVIILTSMVYGLYTVLPILLKGNFTLIYSCYMWAMIFITIIAIIMIITAAGRCIGIDKFIVKNSFTRLIS